MRVRIYFSKGSLPLLFSSLIIILCLGGCAEDSNVLDNGQIRQLEFSVSTHGWDNSDKSSNQKAPSRATPINTFDTSKSFNVIADVNKEGNWSTEVKNEIASYSTENNIWQTTTTHYWPGTGSTVNFYAYYPISIFGNITHNTGSAPILSYTVPDNAADQIDILASSKTGVAGNSYIQTSVDFKHIFAAVQFQVGSSGLPSGTITKVILNNIQYKGTYNLDGTWAPDITDTKSFSQVVSVQTSTGTAITSGATTFMMMPQTLSNDASITITYSNGGTLTKAITGTWEAGKTYTYNLSKTIPVANFDYTGNVQSYTVPLTGTYKIECWGASGGNDDGGGAIGYGGRGGYTEGYIKLNEDKRLYVYVGSQGIIYNQSIYFNGGGITYGAASGGGSTDIRLISGDWNSFESLKSRIMVAAGGGGGENAGKDGGAGGGLFGFSNITGNVSGATQTTGFGFGIAQYQLYNNDGWGGGGNGYYSGLSATDKTNYQIIDGGGGGSSFISGYPGCNAISESSTSTNIIHTGSPNHYSGYVFTNMEMIAGDSQMPAPAGGTEIGHTGNGYASITFVSAN
jgi:hypothetical protein